jgi:hypothetical protein
VPPDKDPAAPADATPGTSGLAPESQASEPGREPTAHEQPERNEADGSEPGPKEPRVDGEPAADPSADAKAQEPPPKRKSATQRRIETLTQELGAAQRRADYYRTQAEKSGRVKELDPLAFRSDAEYQRALIKESSRESRAEFAKGEAQAAAQQAALVEQQIWDARVAEYREEVADFDAVAFSQTALYPEHSLPMLRRMPEGPQVAYYLAKNPAEVQRFSNLSPLDTAFELGRLAQRLKGPPRKAVSQTPNPVPTVRARGAATGFRPDSDDVDGYFAWRDKLQ